MIKIIIVVVSLFLNLLFSLLPQNSFAGEMEEKFKRAGEYYSNGVYHDAIILYEEILTEGQESFKLYYNLGNAYYKLNNFPKAILYYEKALILEPLNEDLKHNLALVNSKIPDKIEPIPLIFYKQGWIAFHNLLSGDTWAILFLVLLNLFFIFSALFILNPGYLSRPLIFWLGVTFLVFTTTAFGFAAQKYNYAKEKPEAIIFSPSLTVKSSPSRSSVDLFVLHEGTKVQITDQIDHWIEIRIANGSKGWIQEENVGRI